MFLASHSRIWHKGEVSLGTATPPCPDHAGSAPNTLTGARVALLCRMFLRRRISHIELTIHASGGRHQGSHWAAVVAYVHLIFGSSKTVVGRTSPYVPRVSACSRKYRLRIRFSLNICMSNQIFSCTASFGSKYRVKAWNIAICPGVFQR